MEDAVPMSDGDDVAASEAPSEVPSSAETLALKAAQKDANYLVQIGCPYWKTFESIACKVLLKLAKGVPLRTCAGGSNSSLSRTVTKRMLTIAKTSAFWDVVDINESGGDALLDLVGLRWANPNDPEDERERLKKGYGVDAIMYGLDSDGKILDIILFQMKAYADLSDPPLGTFFHAQFLVQQHLEMVSRPLAVVVAPFWSTLSPVAKIRWRPNDFFETDRNAYLLRIDTPRPEDDSDEMKVVEDDSAAMKVVEKAIKAAEETAKAEREKKEKDAMEMAQKLRECEQIILNGTDKDITDRLRYRQMILLQCAFGKDRVAHIDQYNAMLVIDAMMHTFTRSPDREAFYCAKLTQARLDNIILEELQLPCLPWHPLVLDKYREDNMEERKAVNLWKSKMSKEYTKLEKTDKAAAKVYKDLVNVSGSRVASFFAPTGCGKSACIAYAVTNWFASSMFKKQGLRSGTKEGRKIAIVFTRQLDSLRQLASDMEAAMCVRFGKDWPKYVGRLSSKEIIEKLDGGKTSDSAAVYKKFQDYLQRLQDDVEKPETDHGLLRVVYCSEASSIFGYALLKRACELGYRTLVIKDEAHHYDNFEELDFALPKLDLEETISNRKRKREPEAGPSSKGRKRKAEAGPSSEGGNDASGDADPTEEQTPAATEPLSDKARGKQKAETAKKEAKMPNANWSAAALSLAAKTEGCLAFVSTATASDQLQRWCDHEDIRARAAMKRTLREAIQLGVLCDYELVILKKQFRKKGTEDEWTDAGADGDRQNGDEERYKKKARAIVADMLENGDRRTIVFCNNNEQAKRIQKLLMEECEKADLGCWAKLCTAHEAKDPQQRISDLYYPFQHRPVQETGSSKITLYFLIGIRILDESLNLPYAQRGVILDLSDDNPKPESIIRFFQRLGRLLRHHPDGRGTCKTLMICSSWDAHLDTLLYYLQEADSDLFGGHGKRSKVRFGSSDPKNKGSDREKRNQDTATFPDEWRYATEKFPSDVLPRGRDPPKKPPSKNPKPPKNPNKRTKTADDEELKGATLPPFNTSVFPPMPWCDKHRLGICCGKKHNVPQSRLHAKPLALYKAVVDASNWRCFAAALAALEEYEGSNGPCTSCQAASRTDGGEGVIVAHNKCNDPFGKGCTCRSSGSNRSCPDCQAEKNRRKADGSNAGAGSSTDPLPSS